METQLKGPGTAAGKTSGSFGAGRFYLRRLKKGEEDFRWALCNSSIRTWPGIGLCALLLSWTFLAGEAAWAQQQPQTPPATSPPSTAPAVEPSLMPPDYPSLDAPWSFGKQKQAKPPPEAAAPAAVQQPPQTQAPTPEATPQAVSSEALPPSGKGTRPNEISVSGDYFLGQGTVTLPFAFALAKTLSPLVQGGLQGTVNPADRSSDYFGGTVSYGAFGQALYLDLAYAHGSSSGEVPVKLGSSSRALDLLSSFSINDDWYQVYIRYTFPSLRGQRFSAYLRGGISFVQAKLTDIAPIPVFGVYSETDNTEDLLGNLGFGVSYFLHRWGHLRLWVQMEGEGFYGRRSQDITESFANNFGLVLSPVSINNDVYGGIGRGTLRLDYRLGRSGAFNVFADGGIQAKYSIINYSGLGDFDELLWGPYVKVGLRYSF